MTDFWLAHLAFGLLAFLLLARFGTGQRLQSAKVLLCLVLSLVPLQGMSMALQLRTYMGDLSISSVVLLSWAVLSRFGLPALATQDRLVGLGLFAGLAVLLYPAALGLSYSDPYQLGFEPRSMLLVIGLLCVILIVLRSWLGALALLLATAAFALRLNASENYWDYLIDPYLALYSLGALLAFALRRLLARRRHLCAADTRTPT
jgi:type IV secretory pathway TrbD component